MIKCYLQLGAIYSKEDSHECALDNMMISKFYFRILSFNLQQLINAHVAVAQQLESEAILERKSGCFDDPYSVPLIKEPELRKFQQSRNSLSKDFLLFCNEVMSDEDNEVKDKDLINNGMNRVIFWKHNSENNEKYLKKELISRGQSMGIVNKFTALGLKEYSIGNVMNLKPLSLEKIIQKMSFAEFFCSRFAVEVILTYCCCLFGIATESRFLCQNKLGPSKETEVQPEGRFYSKRSIEIYALLNDPQFVSR